MFFLLILKIYFLSILLKGQSESTKNRNWGHLGPIRLPDVINKKDPITSGGLDFLKSVMLRIRLRRLLFRRYNTTSQIF